MLTRKQNIKMAKTNGSFAIESSDPDLINQYCCGEPVLRSSRCHRGLCLSGTELFGTSVTRNIFALSSLTLKGCVQCRINWPLGHSKHTRFDAQGLYKGRRSINKLKKS
ncbi:unnamed protein product [Vicia faba]|uniref:Uncharacterized protein n=1 Tax=Vicia faba TaxID=3906 RepID=A0AAV0ZBR8_VICFA|nr:unnamed protein product [Vicia faba]